MTPLTPEQEEAWAYLKKLVTQADEVRTESREGFANIIDEINEKSYDLMLTFSE